MTRKKLFAAGLIITMMLPVGNTALANDASDYFLSKAEISESFKQDATTGSIIVVDKKPSVSKEPVDKKPLFSAKAKSELEKPVEYETGQLVTLPDGNNFYREGYRFVGWNTTPDAETGFFEIVMEKDTVLYAIWVKEKQNTTTESSIRYEKNESNVNTDFKQDATTDSSIEYNKNDKPAQTPSSS